MVFEWFANKFRNILGFNSTSNHQASKQENRRKRKCEDCSAEMCSHQKTFLFSAPEIVQRRVKNTIYADIEFSDDEDLINMKPRGNSANSLRSPADNISRDRFNFSLENNSTENFWPKLRRSFVREIHQNDVMSEQLINQRRSANDEIEDRLHKIEIAYNADIENFEENNSKEVFIEFTKEHRDRLNAIKFGSPDEILISKFNLNITRQDLRTLCGCEWLNDQIINFYMNLLIERSEKESKLNRLPSVYAMNTYFVTRLLQIGYDGIKQWTQNMDIFTKDILLIPVNLSNVHWSMAIIHFKNRTIKHYDSMGSPNKRILNVLKQYLNYESMDKRKKQFETSQFIIESVADVPQQKNDFDCVLTWKLNVTPMKPKMSETSDASTINSGSTMKRSTGTTLPQSVAKRFRNDDELACTVDKENTFKPNTRKSVAKRLPTLILPPPVASSPKILSIKPLDLTVAPATFSCRQQQMQQPYEISQHSIQSVRTAREDYQRRWPTSQNWPQVRHSSHLVPYNSSKPYRNIPNSQAPTAQSRHTIEFNDISVRSQLQKDIHETMEFCKYFGDKIQSLVSYDDYKCPGNVSDIKELYVRFSSSLTRAAERVKGLQDKFLAGMRQMIYINQDDDLKHYDMQADNQGSTNDKINNEIIESFTDVIVTSNSDDYDDEPSTESVEKSMDTIDSSNSNNNSSRDESTNLTTVMRNSLANMLDDGASGSNNDVKKGAPNRSHTKN
uniref:Ubiquitin-like protease family profile domain-containing protein n=1 Tax=Glossina brevipalpis TaxID=37001 RepID=A0A1A9WDH3_9MUSC